MYVRNNQNLSVIDIVALITGITTAISPTINDWLRKQIGLPTSSEEQAKITAQAYEVQKDLAKMKLEQEAQIQKLMIIGGLAIGGILLLTILGGKKK
jgi:hypothetical protein